MADSDDRAVELLEGIHEVLERIEARMEELARRTDLQRETLDGLLVNVMELVDRTKPD